MHLLFYFVPILTSIFSVLIGIRYHDKMTILWEAIESDLKTNLAFGDLKPIHGARLVIFIVSLFLVSRGLLRLYTAYIYYFHVVPSKRIPKSTLS